MCVCESSYFGEKCERSIKNFCNNKNCLNGGSCIYNEEENFAKCVCSKGFTGESCETKNACPKPQSIPCYNNGTCLIGSNNQEICNYPINRQFSFSDCVLKTNLLKFFSNIQGECLSGYSGENCELSLRLHANQSVGRWNFSYLLLFSLLTFERIFVLN